MYCHFGRLGQYGRFCHFGRLGQFIQFGRFGHFGQFGRFGHFGRLGHFGQSGQYGQAGRAGVYGGHWLQHGIDPVDGKRSLYLRLMAYFIEQSVRLTPYRTVNETVNAADTASTAK